MPNSTRGGKRGRGHAGQQKHALRGVFLLFEMRGTCSNTRTRPEGHVLVFEMEEGGGEVPEHKEKGEGRCPSTRMCLCGHVLVFKMGERERRGV